MLFYRDDTFSTIDFAIMALAIAALLFFAVYQISVHFNLEITIPAWVGWFRGTQIVVMLFGAVGAVVSHFLMAMYLKASYWEKGYSLEGSRYCPKCGNRFLVLIPNNTDANLHQQEDLE